MNSRDRVAKILFDQVKPDVEVDWERVQLLLNEENPDADVDWEELQDILGYSSLQVLAFLKGVNAEFNKEVTPEDFQNVERTGGLLALLEQP